MPLTFAYGSNIDFGQMCQRCPSARHVCAATLKDHRLDFTRFSQTRGCGVADAVPDAGNIIWGVVYEVSATDLTELDKHEGYRTGRPAKDNAYIRSTGTVFQNEDESKPINAEIYFAVPQENSPYLPNQVYKNLIVCGARHWDTIPAEYIALLEQIRVIP